MKNATKIKIFKMWHTLILFLLKMQKVRNKVMWKNLKKSEKKLHVLRRSGHTSAHCALTFCRMDLNSCSFFLLFLTVTEAEIIGVSSHIFIQNMSWYSLKFVSLFFLSTFLYGKLLTMAKKGKLLIRW